MGMDLVQEICEEQEIEQKIIEDTFRLKDASGYLHARPITALNLLYKYYCEQQPDSISEIKAFHLKAKEKNPLNLESVVECLLTAMSITSGSEILIQIRGINQKLMYEALKQFGQVITIDGGYNQIINSSRYNPNYSKRKI